MQKLLPPPLPGLCRLDLDQPKLLVHRRLRLGALAFGRGLPSSAAALVVLVVVLAVLAAAAAKVCAHAQLKREIERFPKLLVAVLRAEVAARTGRERAALGCLARPLLLLSGLGGDALYLLDRVLPLGCVAQRLARHQQLRRVHRAAISGQRQHLLGEGHTL